MYAIVAAVLFGASTPAAKLLLTGISPELLAGLLYLGSGVGLFLVRTFRQLRNPTGIEAKVQGRDWVWLLSATFFGGALAPLLLMKGLSISGAGSTSLLLNLEGVFTALIAWSVFKENFDRRILIGTVAIVSGGMLLSWSDSVAGSNLLGPMLVTAACLSWAIDNNFTKKIAASDALQIAMVKGLVAGLGNTLVAVSLSGFGVAPNQVVFACLVGFLGYGVSLLCFVLALRFIGAARTGAYFSLAPFVGAAIALITSETVFSWQLAIASGLMGVGVWVHLIENHEHEHAHDRMEHAHRHVHDEHHIHDHGPDDPPGEPHSHLHRHERLVHTHKHFPDQHHTHAH